MEMFRFANQEYMVALLIIPVLIIIYFIFRRKRKKAIEQFGNLEILEPLMPNASKARPGWKFTILLLAISLLIIGLAQPQFGSKLQKVKRKGIELIIALDVSNSMMAEDIQPNRLERAKRAISLLTERLNNDKIGLIVFAGDAYVQMPITTDYTSTKLFLSSINTSIVPRQGTAIGSAIDLASKSFTPESESNKAIIIITDGENHEDDAISMAEAAQEKDIIVHTIGMGLPQGAPIPVIKPNGQKDFRKDKNGEVVVTKLDEDMLQQIAAAGGGKYVRANNTEVGINAIFDEINKMQKTELESRVYSEYNDQFFYFIAAALILLLAEFLIMERKNKYLKKISLFKNTKTETTI
ncbi:MAG: VWA domain-containing protein [Prolixibacteraceae bacterium]|jgi:Ca-activated chloride channel family protein|nr:VWA domain-containing protein [Prolixibacteraceae bacterium]